MVEVRGEYVHKASASLGVWQIMVLSDFSSKPGFLSTSADIKVFVHRAAKSTAKFKFVFGKR